MITIASDDNNTNFTGATDPEAKLSVRFYEKTLPNNFETAKQGVPVFYNADFVTICLPGDTKTVIDTFVDDSHKYRFPIQWARYQNAKQEEQKAVGTPLAAWPILSVNQLDQLKAVRFYTVESIAGASDLQLQAVGMIAGMQPHAFREKAQAFLKAEERSLSNDEAARLKQENEDIKASMAALRAEIQALNAKREEAPQETKKKGRPFGYQAKTTSDPITPIQETAAT